MLRYVFVAVAFAAMACGGEQPADQGADALRDVTLPPPPPAQADLNDTPPPAEVAPARETTPSPPPTARPLTTATRPAAPRREPPPAVAPPEVAPPVEAPPVETAPPAPTMNTIAAGSDFAVLAPARVCTNTHKQGDRFEATLAEPVIGSDGAVIPAGAKAIVEISQAVVGENDETKVRLAFRAVSVAFGGETYELAGADVVSAPVERVRRQSTGEQATKVATGAVIGAVVGRIVGGNTKGAVAGAAAGAAGGAVVAVGTADYDGCVAEKGRLVVKLTQPVRVRIAS